MLVMTINKKWLSSDTAEVAEKFSMQIFMAHRYFTCIAKLEVYFEWYGLTIAQKYLCNKQIVASLGGEMPEIRSVAAGLLKQHTVLEVSAEAPARRKAGPVTGEPVSEGIVTDARDESVEDELTTQQVPPKSYAAVLTGKKLT